MRHPKRSRYKKRLMYSGKSPRYYKSSGNGGINVHDGVGAAILLVIVLAFFLLMIVVVETNK